MIKLKLKMRLMKRIHNRKDVRILILLLIKWSTKNQNQRFDIKRDIVLAGYLYEITGSVL